MPPVELNPVASTFLVAFYVLASLLLIGALAGLVYVVWKLNVTLEEYRQKVDPLLVKLETVLDIATEKVGTIGDKAETILTQGEETTKLVHVRVDKTTHAVHKTVFTPLIGLNSLLAGVQRGVETFTRRQQAALSQRPRTARVFPTPATEAGNFSEAEHSSVAVQQIRANETPVSVVRPIDSNGAESPR